MLTIGIVEDEAEHAAVLESYCRKYFDGTEDLSVKIWTDGTAYLADPARKTDLLFLDIVMEHSNGMEVAHRIRETDSETLLIFVTNMPQYALEGYSVRALDFLVKPLRYAGFCTAMKHVQEVLKGRRPDMLEILFDRTSNLVDARTILYIETDGKKTLIHTKTKDYPCSETMKTLEERLSPDGFARCHQAYLVNLHYVENVGRQELTLAGRSIPISRYKREEFLKTLALFAGRSL